MQYDLPGGGGTTTSTTTASNEVALQVKELLDVTLTRSGDGALPIDNGTATLPVIVQNSGNGQEAFDVTATTDASGGRVTGIAIDTNGDGRYDPATDTLLTDGRTPSLAPGATIRLIVIVGGLPAGTTGSITVTASAATGSGAPGTEFDGKGDNGADAVVGSTGASATLTAPIGAPSTAPQLVKSAEVRAPDGTTSAIHNAVITYTLEARFPGAVPGVTITDPIPAGTTYRAGSLTLDGVALSDAADGDAGHADASGIAVALGDIAAAGTRTVRFQVTIR